MSTLTIGMFSVLVYPELKLTKTQFTDYTVNISESYQSETNKYTIHVFDVPVGASKKTITSISDVSHLIALENLKNKLMDLPEHIEVVDHEELN
jgi:hypothetical protein